MPPSLATYQAAANAIYDPLAQGEITQAGATRDANIASLESQKGDVNSTFNNSIYDLRKTTDSNSAKIQQQYTLALGGNFSGLQGNDMGMMFADAAHEESTIGQARDNALNDISTKQNNERSLYNANVGSIQAKYNSQKTQYAQSSYADAVNAYNQSLIDQQKLQLEYAKLASSNRNAAASRAASAKAAASKPLTQQQTIAAIRQGLNTVKGNDGHVAPADLAMAYNDFLNAGLSAKTFWANFQGYWNPKQGNYSKQFYAAANKR